MLNYLVWPSLSAAALVSLILYLCRETILAAVKARIQNDHAMQLEAFKASIQEENAKSLLAFKNQIEQRDSLLAYARNSAAEGQRAVMQRRLDAMQDMWNSLLKLNEDIPSIIAYTDNLRTHEFRDIQSRPKGKKLLSEINLGLIEDLSAKHGQISGAADKTTTDIDYSVERVRPLVGEETWLTFSNYRLVLFRVLAILYMAKERNRDPVWYDDDYAKGILADLLDQHELEHLGKVQERKFLWIQGIVQKKMLVGFQRVVSGESSGEEAIQQANRIQKRVDRSPWDVWHE